MKMKCYVLLKNCLMTFLWIISLHINARGERSAVRLNQESGLFDGCRWETTDGGVIDLSSLGNIDNTARFPDVTADYEDFLYSYNPCYPFDEGTCVAAAVCQMTSLKDMYYQAGDATGAELTEDQGRPTIHYQASAEIIRDSYVTLICDQSATTATLKALGDLGYAEYHFELTTKCACSNGCSNGGDSTVTVEMDLSIGSILSITVFSVLVVYVAAGIAYNRARHHKTGMELFPNLPFWAALPSLIKDGCVFTANKLCRRKRAEYQSM